MSHALSVAVSSLHFVATFCVVPAFHRHSFSVALGTEVALDDGSCPSTPKEKTFGLSKIIFSSHQESPGEKYIILLYRFGIYFNVISANT